MGAALPSSYAGHTTAQNMSVSSFLSLNCFVELVYKPQKRTAHIALSSHLAFEQRFYYLIYLALVLFEA